VIVFRCPECQEKFEVENRYGGRKWRCMSCQAAVTIPEASEEPMEPIVEGPRRRRYDDDERDDFDRRDDERRPSAAMDTDERRAWERWADWAVTRAGIRLLAFAVLVFSVSWLFLIIAKYIAEGQVQPVFARGIPPGGFHSVLIGATTVFGLAVIVFVALYIAGQGLCCQVSASAAAKGLAIGSVICSAAFVVIFLITVFIASAEVQVAVGPRGPAPNAALIQVLFWVGFAFVAIGLVLFLFFLERVARHFNRGALAVIAYVELGIVVLLVVYFLVLHLVKGPVAMTLFTGNIGKVAGVGLAVEITFLAHCAVALLGFTILVSLVGSAIRKPRRLKGSAS
jgi:hypothetical protein